MVIDAEKVSPIVPPTALDVETVTALLGRPPSVGFEVVVMNKAGEPVVIPQRADNAGRKADAYSFLVGLSQTLFSGRSARRKRWGKGS